MSFFRLSLLLVAAGPGLLLSACSGGGDGSSTDLPDAIADTGPDATTDIDPPDESLRVVINEVTSTGADFIEFYNAGDEPVDLGGWYYTDDKFDLPSAYTFPDGTIIQPGGFLVRSQGPHHSFGLGAQDGVALFYPDGTLMDETFWDAGDAVVSWCRIPDGTGEFRTCAQQTFGGPNSDDAPECGNGVAEAPAEACDGADLRGATCDDFGFTGGTLSCASDCLSLDTSACEGRRYTVVINEVTSAGSDDVEFYNFGTEAVDISGWSFTDDNLTRDNYYVFPENTVLEPGAFFVRNNDEHFEFGLGGQDEVNLYDADGNLVDRAAWGSGQALISWCRIPDGTGDFRACPQQTFGGPNTDEEPVCGDGAIEGQEVCDGDALGDATCADFGFTGGTLACNTTCDGYVTSACEGRLSTVVINEVTSSGSDDVEFYNYGTEDVDMTGWSFTDDNLTRDNYYVFPDDTVIAPGGFLVVRNPDDFGFGLGGSDEVNLFDADGNLIDSTGWTAGQAVVSWCRIPDGTGDFQTCSDQTFGAANVNVVAVCGNDTREAAEVCDGTDLDDTTCEDLGFTAGTLACNATCDGFDTSACGPRAYTVVINEVTSSGSDDVEFYNYGTEAVDISGWSFTDDELDRTNYYFFPDNTVLQPGAFFHVVKDIDFFFGIGGSDEINLFDADGNLVDSTGWTSGQASVSWCRIPDGTGDFQSCSEQTFGSANVNIVPVCGNDAIEGDEVCDGTDLDDTTCEDLGFTAGTLACNATCDGFDTSACGPRAYTVVINEVTSSGSDDVEFYNYGTEAVDISGWSFTDDELDRTNYYFFPDNTVLQPGAFFHVIKDIDFFFGIGGSDEINLFDADGNLVDSTGWTSGQASVSWCRIPDGTGDFQSCSEQTFGSANVNIVPECGNDAIEGDEVCDGTDLDDTTCEDLGFTAGTLACNATCDGFDTSACGPRAFTVVINEVTSSGSDDVEFYNYGTEAVDISGWSFTDDELDRTNYYFFPDNTVLQPGAFFHVIKDIDFFFGIGGSDQINLFDADGNLVDSTGWTSGQASVSWCRIPDGTGDFQSCSEQTFGSTNVTPTL